MLVGYNYPKLLILCLFTSLKPRLSFTVTWLRWRISPACFHQAKDVCHTFKTRSRLSCTASVMNLMCVLPQTITHAHLLLLQHLNSCSLSGQNTRNVNSSDLSVSECVATQNVFYWKLLRIQKTADGSALRLVCVLVGCFSSSLWMIKSVSHIQMSDGCSLSAWGNRRQVTRS